MKLFLLTEAMAMFSLSCGDFYSRWRIEPSGFIQLFKVHLAHIENTFRHYKVNEKPPVRDVERMVS